MKTWLTALWRRLRFRFWVTKTKHSPAAKEAQVMALLAEGFVVAVMQCRRCDARQLTAIFPENKHRAGECAACHHMEAVVIESAELGADED